MKGIKIFLVFFVLIIAFCISGCEELKQGQVTQKYYKPERTGVSVFLMPITHRSGKGFYTTLVPVTMFYKIPEHWVMEITGTIDDEKVSKTIYVSADVYEKISVGDMYTIREGNTKKPSIDKREATNEEKKKYPIEPEGSIG